MIEIERLIEQAEQWRQNYLRSGDRVLAAASAIRKKALQDALRAPKDQDGTLYRSPKISKESDNA